MLKSIMNAAWKLFREYRARADFKRLNPAHVSFSACLKWAWANFKWLNNAAAQKKHIAVNVAVNEMYYDHADKRSFSEKMNEIHKDCVG